MNVQINFNGKIYNSLDEMPPEVRAAYQQAMALLADQDGNGMPDFVDGLLQGQGVEAMLKPLNVLSAAHTQIVFNGQTYSSVDQMPPEARAAYEQAMGAFDQNRDGVPDALVQGAVNPSAPVVSVMSTTTPPASTRGSAPSPMPMPFTPAGVEPEGAPARGGLGPIVVVLGVAVVVLLLALAAAAVLVLPNLLGGR